MSATAISSNDVAEELTVSIRTEPITRSAAGSALTLRDVHLHDLKHSFAYRTLAPGETLPAIGRLLGHSRVETTARYAHLADASVRQAAIRISDSIADDILGEEWRHDAG